MKINCLKLHDTTIYRGILTGCNDAFIISNETKEALINKDPTSEKIIKPILKGRDIERYNYNFADWHVILAKFGSHKYLPQKYPVIYEHLRKYENRLRQRGQCRYGGKGNKGQHHWLELDNNPNCDYLAEFEKEKLVWIELVEAGRFCYDKSGIYCEATCFIMTGESIKYLCALLNAKLIRWFFPQVAPTSGMGTLRWKKIYVETVPIPKIPTDKQKPFIQLIDEILAAKAIDAGSDTSYLEAEIDRLVYELYGLSVQEIAIINKLSC